MSVAPGARHGLLCSRLIHALASHLEQHPTGRVFSRVGIHPDSSTDVLTAEVAYLSYQRLPANAPITDGFLTVAPEVTFQVLGGSVHWKDIMPSIKSLHKNGTMLVLVFDPRHNQVVTMFPNQPEETRSADQDLVVPGVLPDFSVPISRLFG